MYGICYTHLPFTRCVWCAVAGCLALLICRFPHHVVCATAGPAPSEDDFLRGLMGTFGDSFGAPPPGDAAPEPMSDVDVATASVAAHHIRWQREQRERDRQERQRRQQQQQQGQDRQEREEQAVEGQAGSSRPPVSGALSQADSMRVRGIPCVNKPCFEAQESRKASLKPNGSDGMIELCLETLLMDH